MRSQFIAKSAEWNSVISSTASWTAVVIILKDLLDVTLVERHLKRKGTWDSTSLSTQVEKCTSVHFASENSIKNQHDFTISYVISTKDPIIVISAAKHLVPQVTLLITRKSTIKTATKKNASIVELFSQRMQLILIYAFIFEKSHICVVLVVGSFC